MRILVTGASGLLGCQLVPQLAKSRYEVLAGYNEHTPSGGNPVRLNLRDLDETYATIQKVHPDIIVHAGAMTDVDACDERPELARLINGEAAGRIAEAAHNIGAYLIHISTDYVFDGKVGSYREDDTPNPVNHYGESKLLGEQLVGDSGAKHCIARSSVIYGWGREQRPNFAIWVLGKLRSHDQAKIVSDQFVSPTLNQNLAEMLLDLASKQIEGVLHLAGAARIDRYNLALRMAETFNLDPSLIEPVTSSESSWKAKRPADSSLNVDRAEKLLDKKPLKLIEALDRFRVSERA